jgi:hypothetical protein
MFSKCANPDCTQGFDYRLGRMIRFHNDENPAGPVVPCVRHFWLCDNCSRTHLLEYQSDMGVVIRPRFDNSPGEQAPRSVCECSLGRRSACCLG